MNNKNGVDTFADKNSPSIVLREKLNLGILYLDYTLLTIERTIMDIFGNGVE